MAYVGTSNVRPKPWELQNMKEASPPNKLDLSLSSFSAAPKRVLFNEVNTSPGKENENDKNISIQEINSYPKVPKSMPLNISNQDEGLSLNMNDLNSLNSSAYSSNYLSSGYNGNFSNIYRNNNIVPGYGNNMYGYNSPFGYNNMNNNDMNNPAQSTFQLIEGVIGAVSGFAQMLESTYMATHTSFYTLVSIAEQFNYLKQIFGSALGIFSLMKFMKKILHIATNGKTGPYPSKSSTNSLLIKEFVNFQNGINKNRRHKISWKPLLFFLFSVVGLPYMLNQCITKLQTLQAQNNLHERIDFTKLEFARAIYDFKPENPNIELKLQKGDLMAVLNNKDKNGNLSEWWKVKLKNGDVGYAPYNYLEIIPRNKTKNKNA